MIKKTLIFAIWLLSNTAAIPVAAEEAKDDVSGMDQCFDEDLDYADRLVPCQNALTQAGLDTETIGEIQQSLGDAYYYTDDFVSAVESYEAAISRDPDVWAYHRDLGWAFWKLDKNEDALAAFDAALELNEHDTALRGKALALRDLERYDEAVIAARRAVAFSPKRNSNIFRLARALIDAKQSAQAIELLDPAILNSPTYAKFWQAKADSLSDIGQGKAALKNFKMYATLRPDEEWAHADVAWEEWDLDYYEDAIINFDKAIAIDRDANFVGGKASALSFLERHDEAIELMEQALAIDPSEDWNLNQNGWVFWRADLFDLADKAFDRSLEEHPDYVDSWYGKARTAESQDNIEAALEFIDKAIELEVQPLHLAYHVYYLRQLERSAEAEQAVDTFLVDFPHDPDLVIQKLWALSDQEKVEEAKAHIQSEVVHNPADENLRDEYISFLERSKLWADAIEVAENRIANDGPDAGVFRDLAWYHLQSDDLASCESAALKSIAQDDQWPFGYYYAAECLARQGRSDQAYDAARQSVLNGLGADDRSELVDVFLAEGNVVFATRLGLMRLRD